jgi:hypothetical protein
VAGVLEQVGVGVERDRDACVPEHAADLGWVEPEVDDQVAGERVAEVVEAKRRAWSMPSSTKMLDFQGLPSGASRTRTGDLLGAIQALSQLSYSPEVDPW